MAEATITLKLTPPEFDRVREAISFAASNASAAANDRSTDVALRAKARTESAHLAEILAKLR